MFDVVIVGGSFAGLSAAMQLGRARRSVCVIDAGKPRNRFAEHSHGFFGRDGAPPLTMIAEARAQVAAYPTVEFIDGVAESAKPTQDGFEVVVNGRVLSSKKLLLAFGAHDDLPEVPGLAERWGKTVLPCPYCHGYEFGRKALAVLASGPVSFHQAQLITEWGPTTLFTNGIELDAESREQLAKRNVTIEPARVESVEGEITVCLADGRKLPFAALYIAAKTVMNSPIAAQLGCAFEDGPVGPFITTDAMKATSVPGVFAAGDIARMQPNATFASADGVMAGVAAHRSLVFG